MVSLEGDYLVHIVVCYFSTAEIWPDKKGGLLLGEGHYNKWSIVVEKRVFIPIDNSSSHKHVILLFQNMI